MTMLFCTLLQEPEAPLYYTGYAESMSLSPHTGMHEAVHLAQLPETQVLHPSKHTVFLTYRIHLHHAVLVAAWQPHRAGQVPDVA